MADPIGETSDVPSPSEAESSGPRVGPGLAVVRRARPSRSIVVAAIGLLVAFAAGVWYWRAAAWESTDDAQIDGFVFPVSSRIAGHVARVLVDDNQFVEAGTVLVRLDPKDYEVAVAIARGKLANDEANAAALMTGIPITSADTASQLSKALAD